MDASATGVFSEPLDVDPRQSGSHNGVNSEMVNAGMNNPVVDTNHRLMSISQESRVVLPTLMNNHDQTNPQSGLGGAIDDPISGMYTSMEANALPILSYTNQQYVTTDNIGSGDALKDSFDLEDARKPRLSTLVGRIIDVLRESKEPLTVEQIHNQITDFDNLRKADGTKYKGDRMKAINGALYSTGIFRRTNNLWGLRQAESDAYVQRMSQKLTSQGKKKDGDTTKRKYTRKQLKPLAVFDWLKRTSDRLRMSTNEYNAACFKNPFQGMKGTEDLIQMRKKLGEEKFEMAIQMFNFFEESISKGIMEEEASTKSVDDAVIDYMNRMDKDISDLKQRMEILGKMSGVGSDMAI